MKTSTTEKLLNDAIVEQIKEVFKQLKEPVQILFFGSQVSCEYCSDTLQLVQEVAELSDRLSLNIYDLDDNADIAQKYGVDKAPDLVIAGNDGDKIIDYKIRMAGIPAGHEFSTLIHDLVLVSGRDSGLSQPTREFLSKLTQPVHLQVFVTPT